VFFAHCHPHRLVIHKPSFSAELARNRVPAYLLHAIGALAAMHSKRPALRAHPHTQAGAPFAQAALGAMFDSAGRLRVPADLAAVQALVLLEMVHFTAHMGGVQLGQYQGPPVRAGLALEIARNLLQGRAPPGSAGAGALAHAVERECLRRSMWLTYTLGIMGYLYLERADAAQRRRCIDLTMRLPLDETRFELAELASSTPPGAHGARG
jgi:hypothetical protein